MDLDVILATPDKVEAYCCKGSGQLSLHRAIDELKARGGPKDEEAASRLEWEVEAGRREVSLTEAFFEGFCHDQYQSLNISAQLRIIKDSVCHTFFYS